MERAEINAIGALVASLRAPGEGTLIVAIAAHAGCSDTPDGSLSVTVEASGHQATSEAVYLADALSLARAKLDREAAARAKKAADTKDHPHAR